MVKSGIWKVYLLAAAVIAIWPVVGNADCRATSPAYTTALLELYTSEGCDSCPPADRWFSALDLGAGSTRVAAVAFHVDYWDRLGWRDRFGGAAFTARQYEQMRRHKSGFVYTPQVLLQGNDFDSWRSAGQPAAAFAAINARPARATIELEAAPIDRATMGVDVHVRLANAPDRSNAVVVVALVQSGLESEVKAGENAGRRLHHDHVVRAWKSGLAVGPGGELRQRVNLPLPAERGPLQIVAFVEDDASGEVLQALVLAVCADS